MMNNTKAIMAAIFIAGIAAGYGIAYGTNKPSAREAELIQKNAELERHLDSVIDILNKTRRAKQQSGQFAVKVPNHPTYEEVIGKTTGKQYKYESHGAVNLRTGKE
ncbi:MAG: hypothetical protein Q4E34_04900 [Synergistaceae bacterium]|nr:hypothetical protein [Synergistaceae bacterium]